MEQTLSVDFDGRNITFEWSEADQLILAHVVSVHKAQVSEFPVVVMPVVTHHYIMLKRNLVVHSHYAGTQLMCVGWQPQGDRHGGQEQQGSQSFHGFGVEIRCILISTANNRTLQ